MHEIFNLDLKKTSLVTLSACETGLSKIANGDDLVGLTDPGERWRLSNRGGAPAAGIEGGFLDAVPPVPA